jgi:hypothetical protein
MFDERFDKILKKNLEMVRPAYEPKAWDRFSKRLPESGFLSFVKTYGAWALCGIMMAGWGTTLYTLRENQLILKDLGTTARISTSDEHKPGSQTLLSASHKTDTVYIVKRTIVEHRHYTHDPVSKERVANSSKTTNNEAVKPITEIGIVAGDLLATGLNKANPGETEPVSPIAKQNVKPGGEPTDVIKHYAQAFAIDSSSLGNPSHNFARMDSVNSIFNKETVIAMIDSAWAHQSGRQNNRVTRADSLSNRHPYALEREFPVKPERTPFRLSSLQPRIGIESMISASSKGFGPSIEIFPTENFGVSVGVQASTLRAENHKALRDYNSATGKLFLVEYRSYLPSRFDRISDISIQTSVISLPLNLKYYLPLKNNLSLIVQSGTSLDISAYQQVNFESYLNQSKRRNTFEIDVKPHFFNDLMFGAGVQYRRSRILAQLSPYYVYDFRSIENTESGSNFGVKASVWLNLFK